MNCKDIYKRFDKLRDSVVTKDTGQLCNNLVKLDAAGRELSSISQECVKLNLLILALGQRDAKKHFYRKVREMYNFAIQITQHIEQLSSQ